jgi:hypothetical protein
VIADCPVHQGCPFVFTNNGVKAQGDTVRLKAKLDALLKADGSPPMEPWVFHDFRRSLVSCLAKRGHNPVAIDMLLGHKPSHLNAIARVYQQHDFGSERVAALNAWGQIVTESPSRASRLAPRLRPRRRSGARRWRRRTRPSADR